MALRIRKNIALLLIVTILTTVFSTFAFANEFPSDIQLPTVEVTLPETHLEFPDTSFGETTLDDLPIEGTETGEASPDAIWPLIGAWVSKAVSWLASQAGTIRHIMDNAKHNLAQAGIHTVADLLAMVTQVLSTTTPVHQHDNVWYFFGTWGGSWSVTIRDAIVDDIYRISTLFFNPK